MLLRSFICTLLLSLCGLPRLGAAEEPKTPNSGPLRIPRVTQPPKLDDFLDGKPREAELQITQFLQYQPGDGVPASQPTAIYLSYDDHNLYVGFICKDDKKLIRARVTTRDQLLEDDRVSICIDTFHDHRHMYWFDVNPYGVQMDGTVIDGVEDTAQWDTLWYTDAKITNDGYVGLVAIPFKSIRFPADPEQTWGLIIGRWIMRNNEYAIWPSVSRRRPGFVQQGGDLEGLHHISPGRNIQLIPYGLFSRSRYLDMGAEVSPQYQTENETRAGLDAKLIVKDALALDIAINPDFSQVESDEPQVTINQRYEVFFPEKRPFFMENAGYFKTPQQLFFSRRIADPQLGARLTGRMGKWSLGVLGADDRAPGRRAGSESPFRNRRTGIGVFRLQRDLWANSNIAAMATSQDFGSTHNRVYSIDARLQLLPNWILTGQAMSSDTRLEDGRHLAGPAYYLKWLHAGKHFVCETSYTDRNPDFRAVLGFFDRVDIREASQNFGYVWRPEDSVVQSFGPLLKGIINYNREGRVRDWRINPEFEIALTRRTTVSFERAEEYELYSDRGFRIHHNEVAFRSEWTRWLALVAEFSNGKGINYYPGPGLEPFRGRMREMTAGFTLRPDPHTRIDETYIYSGLRTGSDMAPTGDPAGTAIFNNHIWRTNVKYQFDRRASLRMIVDYSSVLPNTKLVDLEKEKHIGVDILFTYLLNPGTALHVGYTDLYDNLRLIPTLSPALVRTNFPDLNTGRQIFFKLSYLFRF
jgi:hypothetical protein